MSKFELVALGVGDAFSELHRPSALLLLCDGFCLAIDCPDMYRSVLRAASQKSGRELSLRSIDHVLCTHVHGDHMNGLEGVAFYKHFAQGRRLNLVASLELRSTLWEQRLESSMGTLWNGEQLCQLTFDDFFEFHALSWSGAIQVGPFTIRSRRTIHHVPTSALFIEAAGRSLGYSSDTAYDPELIAFLEPANLIVHETNLGPAHTPYAALSRLPASLRQRMRLIHYPDSFDAAESNILPLREGEVVEV